MCVRKCTPRQPGEMTGGAARRLCRSAAIVARPHIARMLDMDMETNSAPDYTDDKLHVIDNDTDTDDERPIAEQQECDLPLPKSGRQRVLVYTPPQPGKVISGPVGRLRDRRTAVEAQSLVACMVAMDMYNDSDTDEERCITEQAEHALPLPHSKHLRVEECT